MLDVVWNFSGEHPLQTINPVYAGAYASGFSATTQIRRSDWGITRTIPYVSDELRITIETEMIRTAQDPEATDPAAQDPMVDGPNSPDSVSPAPDAANSGGTSDEPPADTPETGK